MSLTIHLFVKLSVVKSLITEFMSRILSRHAENSWSPMAWNAPTIATLQLSLTHKCKDLEYGTLTEARGMGEGTCAVPLLKYPPESKNKTPIVTPIGSWVSQVTTRT